MAASGSELVSIQTRPRRFSPLMRRNMINGLLFISPWIIGMLVFTVYPVVASVYYSFTTYDIVSPAKFIGLENFRVLFFEDAAFLRAIKNTAFYALLAIPLGLFISTSVAMLLNMKVRGLAFFRTVFYLPSIVPDIASALLWATIFNTQFGLLNQFFKSVGLPAAGWLTDPLLTKPSLILISLWGFGGSMVIFLAALQDIPVHLYEAAEIDGASPWQKNLFVTLPMITPTIFFNLIMGIIGATQYFTTAYVMLGAGPLDSTRFYMFHLYTNAFRYFKMGYASAMALLLFTFVLLVTLVLFKTSGRWVYYERSR
jgi:multiple sugar transport system permease protein